MWVGVGRALSLEHTNDGAFSALTPGAEPMRSIHSTVYAASKIRNVPVGLAMLFMLATAACGSATENVGNESSEANGVTPIIVDAGGTTPPRDGGIVPPGDAGYVGDAAVGDQYRSFLGAWTAEGVNPFVSSIVFEDVADGTGHAFFADKYLSSPTSSSKAHREYERFTGSYSATERFIMLEGSPAFAGSIQYFFVGPNRILGIINGDFIYFNRDASFCEMPSDCAGQDIKHVECVGGFSCTANRCEWICGGPVKGDPCGDSTCNFGERCCNPLKGVCTPAGIACEQ